MVPRTSLHEVPLYQSVNLWNVSWPSITYKIIFVFLQKWKRADPGFFFFFFLGGAQNIMCMHAHHKHEDWSPLRPGSRTRLRALEALGVLMLSRAIWALLSILIQNGIKKQNIADHLFFGGGGGGGPPATPPLDPQLWKLPRYIKYKFLYFMKQ